MSEQIKSTNITKVVPTEYVTIDDKINALNADIDNLYSSLLNRLQDLKSQKDSNLNKENTTNSSDQ